MYCMSVVYEICRWLGFVVCLTHVQYIYVICSLTCSVYRDFISKYGFSEQID
jgi:hypothetical protein